MDNKTEIPLQLFITGTDTSIGKTVVSAVLMAGLKGKYWKPIQSGLEQITDTQWIREKTRLPEKHFYKETYRLKHPLSPHAAAALEKKRINTDNFIIPKTSEHLIIEGAGGIMVPLNERDFMLDLMKKFNIPILLTASSSLGTINHTLLSIEQMRRHQLNIFGVVLNGKKNPSNRDAVEYYGNIKICAEIEPLSDINPHTLMQTFKNNFGTEK